MNELQKKYPECVDPNYCRDISLKERKRMRRAEERRGDLVNLSDRQITDSLGPFTPTSGQSTAWSAMVHSIHLHDEGGKFSICQYEQRGVGGVVSVLGCGINHMLLHYWRKPHIKFSLMGEIMIGPCSLCILLTWCNRQILFAWREHQVR